LGEGDGHSREKERETIVRSGIVRRRKGDTVGRRRETQFGLGKHKVRRSRETQLGEEKGYSCTVTRLKVKFPHIHRVTPDDNAPRPENLSAMKPGFIPAQYWATLQSPEISG